MCLYLEPKQRGHQITEKPPGCYNHVEVIPVETHFTLRDICDGSPYDVKMILERLFDVHVGEAKPDAQSRHWRRHIVLGQDGLKVRLVPADDKQERKTFVPLHLSRDIVECFDLWLSEEKDDMQPILEAFLTAAARTRLRVRGTII